jgi:hypothetical protein
MPLWVWVILFAIVFLISYDKRSGNLQEFFSEDKLEKSQNDDSRKAQSSGNTDESS